MQWSMQGILWGWYPRRMYSKLLLPQCASSDLYWPFSCCGSMENKRDGTGVGPCSAPTIHHPPPMTLLATMSCHLQHHSWHDCRCCSVCNIIRHAFMTAQSPVSFGPLVSFKSQPGDQRPLKSEGLRLRQIVSWRVKQPTSTWDSWGFPLPSLG